MTLLRNALVPLGLAALLGGAATAAEQPLDLVPPGRDATADEPGDSDPSFEQLLTEWRALLARLRSLQQEFATADDARKGAIRTEFAEAVERGERLEPRLIRAAERAVAAPGAAPEGAVALLAGVLRAEVDADNYEEAFRLGEVLCENTDAPGAPALTGIAAFATSRFDAAENYLKQAAAGGTLSERGRNFLAEAPRYKQLWAAEQKIRAAEAEADDLPRVLLKTSKGDIEIELFENEAPNTVANFVSLVEKGFYDGVTFHRVLAGFMAQGGCPQGTGTGGPGYHIACECHQPGYRRHFRGSLSMAHAGRDTGGSQFFLTFLPTAHLDGRHTAFGRVTAGLDVLARLQRRDPMAPNPPQPDRILEAKVLRKRDHEYTPTKVR